MTVENSGKGEIASEIAFKEDIAITTINTVC